MRLRTILAASGVALLATLAIASPANAASSGHDTIAPTTPVVSAETSQDAANRAALQSLIGSQTDEQIRVILNSGEPTEALADPVSGKVVAARYSSPAVSIFTISPSGPGCASTDACATNAYKNGYYGTGQLTISLYNVTKIFAGDKTTTWWQGGTGTVQAPYNTLYFGGSGAHLTSITRS